MFSLFGPREIIRHAYLLGCARAKQPPPGDLAGIRAAYLDFLAGHQPRQPVNRHRDKFVDDAAVEVQLARAYTDSRLDDRAQSRLLGGRLGAAARDEIRDGLEAAAALLRRRCAALHAVYDLLVHSIFCRAVAPGATGGSRGGSSSSAIGTIWVSDAGHPTVWDRAEFLLHEFTHHALFVAERCHPQFVYAHLHRPETFVLSAILHTRRPLDKVVHSIVVATEIVLARQTFLRGSTATLHPPSKVLARQARVAMTEVAQRRETDTTLTPWTHTLLARCSAALDHAEQTS